MFGLRERSAHLLALFIFAILLFLNQKILPVSPVFPVVLSYLFAALPALFGFLALALLLFALFPFLAGFLADLTAALDNLAL